MESEKKHSLLWLDLLRELTQHYRDARKIHVILDNYSMHSTEPVALSLRTPEGWRLRLCFLSPYCPDHNKMERTWQGLHAKVTRSHTCRVMTALIDRVRRYLKRRNQQHRPQAHATAA